MKLCICYRAVNWHAAHKRRGLLVALTRNHKTASGNCVALKVRWVTRWNHERRLTTQIQLPMPESRHLEDRIPKASENQMFVCFLVLPDHPTSHESSTHSGLQTSAETSKEIMETATWNAEIADYKLEPAGALHNRKEVISRWRWWRGIT